MKRKEKYYPLWFHRKDWKDSEELRKEVKDATSDYLIIMGVFIVSFCLFILVFSKAKEIDLMADLYQHRIIYYVTQEHPVVFGLGCIALVLVGCWILAKKTER